MKQERQGHCVVSADKIPIEHIPVDATKQLSEHRQLVLMEGHKG